MKILIISHENWSENNNGGNVLSNIFSSFDAEFAQIYCSPGLPNNSICKRYFQISDDMVIKGFFLNKQIGRIINFDITLTNETYQVYHISNQKHWYFKIFEKLRLSIFTTFREFLWKVSDWKTDELIKFTLDFKPDIIFAPSYSHLFMSRIARYIKHLTGVPMISYISDDSHSFLQYSLSPIFWFNRLLIRRSLRKTFPYYDLVYTMTDEQAKEIKKLFNPTVKILRKGSDFKGAFRKDYINTPIRMVYAGGIYINRWKTLARIGQILNQINKDSVKIRLDIYTQNKANKKQRQLLNDNKCIFLHDPVNQNELKEIYCISDIALHVESFDLKYRLMTRLSFSTKIVDCLASSCAVMAVSWKEHAGLKYLKKEDAAFCIDNYKDLKKVLEEISHNPEVIYQYALKAWKCGKRNHQRDVISINMKEDFNTIINEKHSQS